MNEVSALSGLPELRRLFQTDLKAVRFPGVDGEVLAVAASRVQEALREVERAEAQLAAARALLADAEEDELARAHRALAYARVYAEDLPELHQRLQDLALPTLPALQLVEDTASAAPKRRGRPSKAKTGGAPSLFAPTLAASLDAPDLGAPDAPDTCGTRDSRDAHAEPSHLTVTPPRPPTRTIEMTESAAAT